MSVVKHEHSKLSKNRENFCKLHLLPEYNPRHEMWVAVNEILSEFWHSELISVCGAQNLAEFKHWKWGYPSNWEDTKQVVVYIYIFA